MDLAQIWQPGTGYRFYGEIWEILEREGTTIKTVGEYTRKYRHFLINTETGLPEPDNNPRELISAN